MKKFLLLPEVRKVWGLDDEPGLLAAYERVWERKAILRTLYGSWYQQIAAELRTGSIVEIGAGTGNFKRWLAPRPSWTIDILPGKYVDVRADALQLPFSAESVDNIVMIDALHHIARPHAFLEHAATILRPGGRLLLFEPFVSAWGWFVYKFLHHERVDFAFQESTAPKEAWDGNAAIPQLVLSSQHLPLAVKQIRYREFLAYPLCGGFSYRSLLPSPVLLGLHRLEQLPLFQNRLLSLRIFAVLEKIWEKSNRHNSGLNRGS